MELKYKPPRCVVARYDSHLRHTRWDGEERPRRASWWTDHTLGHLRLFITCWNCGHMLVLEDYYQVHPLGYLCPCVKCTQCGHEGYRRLMDWKPLKIFTATLDWKERAERLQDKFIIREVGW
jgi:hypothetical protein